MQFILAYLLLNFIPGLSLYLCSRKSYRWSDLIGFSLVYSICFTPVILYLLRLINQDDHKIVTIMALIAPIIIYPAINRYKLKFESDDGTVTKICLSIVGLCGVFLYVVDAGLIDGTVYYNNVFDAPKHYGTLISVASNSNLHIDNPFASTFQMFYYFFFYIKEASLLNLSGLTKTFSGTTITFFTESLTIFYAIIFMFFKIGKKFGIGLIPISGICLILLVDGGYDSLYVHNLLDNEVSGGYIDGWPRTIYSGLPLGSVLVHSNLLMKLIWQPQHLAAIVSLLALVYILSEMIERKERDYKLGVLSIISIISMFGYSALISAPSFLFVLVTVIWFIFKKQLNIMYLVYFLLSGVISIPLLKIYFGNKGNSSTVIFQNYHEFYTMLLHHPWVTLTRFSEYGLIFPLFITALIYAIVKKSFGTFQLICIILISTCFSILVFVEMPGLNDLGMATSTVLYFGLFLFVLSVPMNWMYKQTSIVVVLIILLLPGIWTNAMGIQFHNTMNVTLKHQNDNIMKLSEYMIENTNYDDTVVFLSPAVRDLNRFVPILFHTKTFHPFVEGPQYLKKKDLVEVNAFIKDIGSNSLDKLVNQYKRYGTEYFIVLPNSPEQEYFKNQSPVYSNKELIVYKVIE